MKIKEKIENISQIRTQDPTFVLTNVKKYQSKLDLNYSRCVGDS